MPKTNHPIEQEELMAYLDGELPVERAGFAAGHLEHCRECQGIAADLQGVSRRLMDWQVEPVSEDTGPVLAAALREAAAPRRPRRIWRWLWAVAGTGLAVLAVVSSIQLKPRNRLNADASRACFSTAPLHRRTTSFAMVSVPMIARTPSSP